jgi:hypothetical protein
MYFHLTNLLGRKTEVMKLTLPQYRKSFEFLLIKHVHIQLRIIGNLSHNLLTRELQMKTQNKGTREILT